MRDVVQGNALLLLNCALVYLDFADACRSGYSGRVKRCIQIFTVMFQGTKFTNYAAECLHSAASIKHIWKPQFKFKQAWLDYCLINPDGRTFCAVDRHGETVIRENKDKVRPSANAKSDDFLRKPVARNIPTLRACKAAMYRSTGAIDYGYRHSSVDTPHDVALISNTLSEARVFEMVRGRGSSTAEMVDSFAQGTRAVAVGWVLKKYKESTRATWAFTDDQEMENLKARGERGGDKDSSDEDDMGEDADYGSDDRDSGCDDMDALEVQTRLGVNEDEDEGSDVYFL